MFDIAQGIGQVLRSLASRSGASLLVIVVLALGLGTGVTVFSIAEAALTQDLSVSNPERLIYVASQRVESGGLFSVRLHEALAWRKQTSSFDGLTILHRETVHLRSKAGAKRVGLAQVEPSYFEVLGVRPVLGRVFLAEDLGKSVTMISYELWQKRFGGDDSIVGQEVDLGGISHAVIGVMPPGPQRGFLGWRDLWTPIELDESAAEARQMWGYSVLGRLRHGVSIDSARQDLKQVSARLASNHPQWNEGWAAEARPVRDWIFHNIQSSLKLLSVAALLVLLVAVATAANLLYASTTARRQEMAVRRALGAGSRRLLGRLAAECTVLAILAAGLGLGLAALTKRTAMSWLPTDWLVADRLSFGPRTLLGVALVTVVTAALCALLSAVALRRPSSLAAAAKARGDHRLRAGLIVFETAIATLAIAGSMLLIGSLKNVEAVAPGFDPAGLLTLRMELPAEALTNKQERIAVLARLCDEVATIPGVRGAALAGFGLPLTGETGVFQVWVEGGQRPAEPDVMVNAQVVSPGWFQTLGVEWISGRDFATEETWDSHHGVIVNRAFAETYLPPDQALGRWVEFGNGERGTVIGVTENVRQMGLDQESAPEIYLAWGSVPRSQALIVRAEGELVGLGEQIRRKMAEALPGVPIYDLMTGAEILRSSYRTRRVTTWALTTFAALAQLLGMVGLYGLVWHGVMSRRREFGLRSAVGARPFDLVQWTLRFGLKPVFLGLALGGIGSIAAGRFLESRLFGVEPADPRVLALAAAVVLVASLITSLVPAHYAAGVEPSTVLRSE